MKAFKCDKGISSLLTRFDICHFLYLSCELVTTFANEQHAYIHIPTQNNSMNYKDPPNSSINKGMQTKLDKMVEVTKVGRILKRLEGGNENTMGTS